MSDVEDSREEEFLKSVDEEVASNKKLAEEKKEEIVDISGDGKLAKKILTQGSGYILPSNDAEVTIHYTATIDNGPEFENTRNKGAPLTFKLGTGAVTKALEDGVKSMKKGEHAAITCAPEFAYGEKGLENVVPPNSIVTYDVELLNWSQWTDVTTRPKGCIVKKFLEEGKGWDRPEFDTVVKVSYTLRLDGGSEKVVEQKENFSASIGLEELMDGLEKLIESMCKEEHCIAKIKSDVAYGEKGNDALGIPPNANLLIDITLHEFSVQPKPWNISAEENINLSTKLKDDGGRYYKLNKVKIAKQKYQLALPFSQYQQNATPEQKQKLKANEISILLNIAACDIREKKWESVIEYCTLALGVQPGNTKALLRRGKAYNELDQWPEAKADLSLVAEDESCSENAEGKREFSKLQSKVKNQNEKDKKIFTNMFDRMREMKDVPPSSSKSGSSPLSSSSSSATSPAASRATPSESSSQSKKKKSSFWNFATQRMQMLVSCSFLLVAQTMGLLQTYLQPIRSCIGSFFSRKQLK